MHKVISFTKVKNICVLLIFIIFICVDIVFLINTAYGKESTKSNEKTFTVKESIKIALSKSKNLLIARSKIDESYYGLGISKTTFLPKLSTVFNYTRLDEAPFFPTSRFARLGMGGGQIPPEDLPKKITVGDYNNYAAALSIRQPIYTGGKIINSYKIAELETEVAETNLQKSENELIYDVENAYWNVVKAQEFRKVSEDAVKQVNAHMKDLENMYQVGMITENDLLRTKVQLSNAELALIRATNGVKLTKIAFCNTLGIPLDTEVELVDKLKPESIPEIDLKDITARAHSHRPEVKSMQTNIRIAKKAVDISRAGYLPNIHLSADYGYRRPDREYNRDFYGSWAVSLLFQFNIFDWGETSFRISEARNRLNQVEIAKSKLEDGITLEVTQNYLKLLEAKEKIEMSRVNVQQAEENYRVTDEKFKEGMTTNTELLDANTLLTQAKTEYISALADYKVAIAGLKKSTGELYKTK